MIQIKISDKEKRQLEEYRGQASSENSEKALMVIMNSEIMSPVKIAQILKRNPHTVRKWLKRYQQETGQYPANLKELVEAGYIKELPMDPYSEKPLAYKRTQDNFMLYSVGSNFKDDGGQVAKGDNGRALSFAAEGDWVFWPVQ